MCIERPDEHTVSEHGDPAIGPVVVDGQHIRQFSLVRPDRSPFDVSSASTLLGGSVRYITDPTTSGVACTGSSSESNWCAHFKPIVETVLRLIESSQLKRCPL